jgi:hypothetical protein
MRSSDSGTTWKPDDLPFALPQMLVADPRRPTSLPARGPGAFKSVDGGATWRKATTESPARTYAWPSTQFIRRPGTRPRRPFTGGTSGIYKTVDGANQ